MSTRYFSRLGSLLKRKATIKSMMKGQEQRLKGKNNERGEQERHHERDGEMTS